MTNNELIFNHKKCPNCLSDLNEKHNFMSGMMLDASSHMCPKCGCFTHWDRTGDISFDNIDIAMKGKAENELFNTSVSVTDSTFIVDQKMLASKLMSDIRTFHTKNDIEYSEECAGYVKFFEQMFDDIIQKEGSVTNKVLRNIMELISSDEFLEESGMDERHIILDSYLLSICKVLYSGDLDLVELFDKADKYYA